MGTVMKRTNRMISAVLCLLCVLSLAGCAQQADFNVTGYIEAMLVSSYTGDNTEYMSFTSQSDSQADENNSTTVNNALVRFRNKYNLFTTEEQDAALSEVFKTAYANSRYTVRDKTEASYGYDVVISYTPQTTFSDISGQIQNLIDSSSDTSGSEDGENYIDKIIALCSNMVENPSYGEDETITIDIQESESGELSMNINLFDQLDSSILPF